MESRDWSSDVCSSDLEGEELVDVEEEDEEEEDAFLDFDETLDDEE